MELKDLSFDKNAPYLVLFSKSISSEKSIVKRVTPGGGTSYKPYEVICMQDTLKDTLSTDQLNPWKTHPFHWPQVKIHSIPLTSSKNTHLFADLHWKHPMFILSYQTSLAYNFFSSGPIYKIQKLKWSSGLSRRTSG